MQPMLVDIYTRVFLIYDRASLLQLRETLNGKVAKQTEEGWVNTGGSATRVVSEIGDTVYLAEGFVRYELPPTGESVAVYKLRFKRGRLTRVEN